MTDKHTTPMFDVHTELTGIMSQQLEQQLPEHEINTKVLTHYFEQTSTNPLWNYTTTIQPLIV